MRLFAAITPPPEIIEELADWWSEASLYLEAADWRDVPSRNWHLTLAFYGDVSDEEAEEMADRLADEVTVFAPLSLRLNGFGCFPRMARANVFWAGVEDCDSGAGRLGALARCCRRAGRATVRKRSAREGTFHGHITVARARGFPVSMAPEQLAELPPVPQLEWQADALQLYRSHLHPDGARYRIIEEFSLEGS